MMNRGYFEKSLLMKVVSLIRPDWIMEYLTALRKVEYYSNRGGCRGTIINTGFANLV